MTATLPSRSPSVNPAVYRQNLLRLHELLVEKQRRVQLQDRRQRLSEDLGAFFREAWTVLEPGRPLTWSWHYDLIAEYLWLVREGKFKARFNNAIGLITNVSPRSSTWATSFSVTSGWSQSLTKTCAACQFAPGGQK